MRLVLPVLAVLLCAISLAAAQVSPTYGQLALALVPGNFTAVLKYLPQLNETTLPQNIAVLRKSLLYLRDLLDVFVFVYPYSDPDVWALLREDMNVGYTIIGNFQDLNHSGVNYTQEELEERRDECLGWQTTFTNNSVTYNYEVYIGAPATNGTLFFERNITIESEFFWKDAGVFPNPFLSGQANIAALTNGLLELGVERYPIVMALPEVYSYKRHLTFHDYRKLSRTVNWLSIAFPVFDNGTYANLTNGALNITNQMYNLFGNLNDEATAYQFYQQNGPLQLQAQQAVIVQQGWFNLTTWLLSVAYDLQLSLLSTLIIPD